MFYARGNVFACILLFFIALWPLGLILIGFVLGIREYLKSRKTYGGPLRAL